MNRGPFGGFGDEGYFGGRLEETCLLLVRYVSHLPTPNIHRIHVYPHPSDQWRSSSSEGLHCPHSIFDGRSSRPDHFGSLGSCVS